MIFRNVFCLFKLKLQQLHFFFGKPEVTLASDRCSDFFLTKRQIFSSLFVNACKLIDQNIHYLT